MDSDTKIIKVPTFQYHRFLDEAGDTTFYGKGKTPLIGADGVSSHFILGMLTINEPINEVREKVIQLKCPAFKKRKQRWDIFFTQKMMCQRLES